MTRLAADITGLALDVTGLVSKRHSHVSYIGTIVLQWRHFNCPLLPAQSNTTATTYKTRTVWQIAASDKKRHQTKTLIICCLTA